jgi:hypothetical protein
MARPVPLLVLVLLAGCARSEDASVVAANSELQAVEQVRTPEQDDEALALGDWRETLQDENNALEFGPAGAPPLFSLRCDARRSVYVQHHGSAQAGDLPMMLVTVGSETRRLAVTGVAGPPPMLRASLSPSDTLINILGTTTTPITVRIGDTEPLVLPPAPSVGAFLTRCESGAQTPQANRAVDANASTEANAAAPAPPARR